MKTHIILFSLLISLIGCSGTPTRFTDDSKRSEALNVAFASGMSNEHSDLKDVSYEDVQKSLKARGIGGTVETLGGVGLAGAKFSGSMLATPGVSSGLGGTLMLLHALTKSDYKGEHNGGYVIWMPKSEAKDSDEAKTKLHKIFNKAIINALPDDYKVHKETVKFKPTFGDEKTYHFDVITGGNECDRTKNECRLGFFTNTPLENHPTPIWMSHKKAYRWSPVKIDQSAGGYIYIADKINRYSIDGRNKPKQFKNDDFWLKVSANLPDWVYHYRPPNAERKYPVMFHQGKVLYFIAPKKSDANKTAAIN